jgi:hypothetical protein
LRAPGMLTGEHRHATRLPGTAMFANATEIGWSGVGGT